MSLVMSTAVMTGRTLIGICRIDFNHVFVDVIEVHVMQVTIMQIIGVGGMSDSHMAAGDVVLMVVPLMLGGHAGEYEKSEIDVAEKLELCSLLNEDHPSEQRDEL